MMMVPHALPLIPAHVLKPIQHLLFFFSFLFIDFEFFHFFIQLIPDEINFHLLKFSRIVVFKQTKYPNNTKLEIKLNIWHFSSPRPYCRNNTCCWLLMRSGEQVERKQSEVNGLSSGLNVLRNPIFKNIYA